MLFRRQNQDAEAKEEQKRADEALLLYVTSTINPRLWKLGICDMTPMDPETRTTDWSIASIL
jgi:hypothetical protein